MSYSVTVDDVPGIVRYAAGRANVALVQFDGDGIRVTFVDGSWRWFPNERIHFVDSEPE